MDRRDPFGEDSAKGQGKADPCGMTTKKAIQLPEAGPPPAAKDDNQKTKQKQKSKNKDDGNSRLQQIPPLRCEMTKQKGPAKAVGVSGRGSGVPRCGSFRCSA
jgi:hypothetical protein